MKKIIAKHSSIIINDYNLGDNRRLENNFLLYDHITHKQYFKGIEYIEEENKLILPRGIDIYYLENMFNSKVYIDSNNDPMDMIDQINIKYKPRDNVQFEALQFMTGNSVKYKAMQSKSQLSVNLNTGKGKTYCSIVTSAIMRLRSAIITSSINWINQWKDCILEYTDTKPREIFIISGTPSIQRLLKKDINQYKFILISHSTIKSYGDTFGWNKVTELFKFMRIGLKFYDECHLNFDNMCKIDYYTNTYKTYYVTATPARSDKDENQIFQLYFKNIPAIDLFDEELDPHTQYIAIRYNSKPSPMDISNCKNRYGLDRNKYTGYIVKQDNFYKILRIILDIAMSKPGKTLIYIGTNNAIKIVFDWIMNNYPELYNNVGIYTSIIPENMKEIEKDKKIILSTTKSTGTAMDIKGLSCTVVLAEPFKSWVIAKQTLGRTRDNNTMYIEVVDNGFNQILKYYYYKKPIFSKYATSCTEINLKQNELDIRNNNIENKLYKMRNPIKLVNPFEKI